MLKALLFAKHPSLPPNSRILLLCLFALALAGCQIGGGPNPGIRYYVHPNGNNENSGTSPEQAWQTIAKVNGVALQPGDRVLFAGGSVFTGTLEFNAADSADAENRLLIASYGDGIATIDGGNAGALIAEGCDYLTIKNLRLTGAGRKTGNTADGVFITQSHFVKIDSLEVAGFQHSGLLLHICDNARITHVYAHDNGATGIHVTGTTWWDSTRYDNHNLYIGYCVAENNPGDPTALDNHSGSGIIASSTDGGVIEYCEAFNNGWDMPWTGNGPVGIWIWDSQNFVIQYCISHDNKSNPVAADGGGFDFDGGTANSILQYNLSYNNQGPAVGLFEFGARKVWENNVVRYNISQNDGKNGQGSLAIWKGEADGTIRNCQIYNNTFYNSNPNGPNLCVQNNWQGFEFRNNVFVYNGPFLYAANKLGEEKFENNLYWNLAGEEKFLHYPNIQAWAEATGNEQQDGRFIGIYADPRFENAGAVTLTSPLLLHENSLAEYAPAPDSPLIDAGLDLAALYGLDPGKFDVRGQSIPQGQRFDIGAVEFVPGVNHE